MLPSLLVNMRRMPGSGIDSITVSDYDLRNMRDRKRTFDTIALQREILLGFWKIHILHHAGEDPERRESMEAGIERQICQRANFLQWPLLPPMSDQLPQA